jgi:anaerobic selenocysteine-containing dehydrogenase
VREALKKLELFVVSENVRSNDTVNAGAHVLLPAQAWGEKSGTVTNSERRISRQRAFLPRAGEAKPDWWIVSEVAKRLGFGAAFNFNPPPTFSASTPRCRRSRTTAAAISISARCLAVGRGFDALARCCGRCAGRAAAAAALFRRRRLLHQRPQGALHRAGNSRAAQRDHRRAAAAAQYRAHPRSMAHHDAQRHEPAARPASA